MWEFLFKPILGLSIFLIFFYDKNFSFLLISAHVWHFYPSYMLLFRFLVIFYTHLKKVKCGKSIWCFSSSFFIFFICFCLLHKFKQRRGIQQCCLTEILSQLIIRYVICAMYYKVRRHAVPFTLYWQHT